VVNVRRLVPPALLFGLGLWLFRLYQPFSRAITIDNQLYFFIAERVAAGVPPHLSLVDHKHALSAMLSGWAMLLGRAAGIDDVYSVRILSMILAATLPCALWAVAFRLTRREIVAHITAFVALSFDDFFVQAAMGVRPQLFMAIFMVYSFAALGARRYVTAGATAIASFLCWQPALLVFGSSCVAILLERSSKRALVRYVAGGLIVLLMYEGYFWYHGALREQLFQSYVLPSELGGYKYKPLWDGLVFVLRDGRWGLGWLVVIPAVYLATLVLLVLEPLVRWRRFWERLRGDALPGALAATALLALAFTLIDHQAYPDRYFLQPFIALANGLVWGLPIAWLCERVGPANRFAAAVSIAVFAAGAIRIATDTQTSYPPDRAVTLAKQRQLANRVAALRRRYGPVWAVGCGHLLALRRTGNFDFIGLVIDPKVRHYMESMSGEDGYRPRNGSMPVVLLTSRGGEGIAFSWLRREYWPVRDEAFEAQGIRAWLRKECLVDRKCRALFECVVRPQCWPHAHPRT
jgi:hypothetical protein